MWSESSSLSTVNLEKKIFYSSRDIEYFLGGYFFMARPVYIYFKNIKYVNFVKILLLHNNLHQQSHFHQQVPVAHLESLLVGLQQLVQ